MKTVKTAPAKDFTAARECAIERVRSALAMVASFSESEYKESGDESGINARYYLEQALEELTS